MKFRTILGTKFGVAQMLDKIYLQKAFCFVLVLNSFT